MVMNLYREVDREKLQFDFVVHDLGENNLDDEITKLGGRIYKVPLLSRIGIKKFIDMIYTIIIENGPYTAVHTHTDYQGGFSALAAKKAGVPIRICHAHSDTRSIHSPLFLLKKLLGRAFIQRYATQRSACSRNAGIALHGKRAVDKGLVCILKNGIDLNGYSIRHQQHRETLCRECNVGTDVCIIGNVGRLSPVKNQGFILECAAEAKRRGLNYIFVCVGSGEMMEALLNERCRAGLEDNTFFLGTRKDIPQLMQSFDVFILPSFYEGMPLTVIEAQAAGTAVLAAPCVPQEADMGIDLLHLLPLGVGVNTWLEKIGEVLKRTKRPDAQTSVNAVRHKGFDAKYNVNVLMELYGLYTIDQKLVIDRIHDDGRRVDA